MQVNLRQSVLWIMESEGATLNTSASEPGGASKYGISMMYLREVRPSATLEDLRFLTFDGAADIYANHVAKSIRFNDLPAGVDYRLLDIRVNLGLTGGIKALELALGRFPIGKLDDPLVGVTMTTNAATLISCLSAVWLATKHCSPNWKSSEVTKNGYGKGWTNRNTAATLRAFQLAGSYKATIGGVAP